MASRISKLLPVRSGVSQRKGNEWKALRFVFEYFEHETDRYADSVMLETFDTKVIENLKEGMEVRCGFGHRTREYEGKTYFVIGFPNIAGGYELRNRYFKGCLAPKDITHIRQQGEQRDVCYLFEGFMDYLSFLTIRVNNNPEEPRTEEQDYMVLNSVANVSKALYPLGNYERIHCFFDNDRAGMEALQQIRMEYGRDLYIRDASQTYSGCKDLNEYLQKQTERNRQVQSAKGVRSQPPKKKNGFRL